MIKVRIKIKERKYYTPENIDGTVFTFNGRVWRVEKQNDNRFIYRDLSDNKPLILNRIEITCKLLNTDSGFKVIKTQ